MFKPLAWAALGALGTWWLTRKPTARYTEHRIDLNALQDALKQRVTSPQDLPDNPTSLYKALEEILATQDAPYVLGLTRALEDTLSSLLELQDHALRYDLIELAWLSHIDAPESLRSGQGSVQDLVDAVETGLFDALLGQVRTQALQMSTVHAEGLLKALNATINYVFYFSQWAKAKDLSEEALIATRTGEALPSAVTRLMGDEHLLGALPAVDRTIARNLLPAASKAILAMPCFVKIPHNVRDAHALIGAHYTSVLTNETLPFAAAHMRILGFFKHSH